MTETDSTGEAVHGGNQAMVGRLLAGRWRIQRHLGSGGTSAVYAATHRNGKRVAIKLLRPELSSRESAKRRLLREGYIANAVDHPGAVGVFDDHVTDDGRVFLVMELLEGFTLEELRIAEGGSLAPEAVVWLVTRLLEILQAAHGSGVVHRDVKPGNVFLTSTGEVKLLDFGIARIRELSNAGENTASDVTLGTPAFMAPEQARGRWNQVDERTDLWGVGATVLRLLTGRFVHRDGTANERMIAAATQRPASLAVLRPDLPDSLVRLVDGALRVDPQERFASASEMLLAAEAAACDLPPLEVPLCARVPPSTETLDERSPGAWTRGDGTGSWGARIALASDVVRERYGPRAVGVIGIVLIALAAAGTLGTYVGRRGRSQSQSTGAISEQQTVPRAAVASSSRTALVLSNATAEQPVSEASVSRSKPRVVSTRPARSPRRAPATKARARESQHHIADVTRRTESGPPTLERVINTRY